MDNRAMASALILALTGSLVAGCGGGSVDGGNAQPDRLLAVSAAAVPAYGVVRSGGYLTVSTGAGLVFKVREAGGDITSITYNGGPELQAQTKFSHISSGIGASTAYSVSGSVIKITLSTSTLTHYLLVRQNENNIYMGTYITAEPAVGELRWITRLNGAVLTGVPAHSDLRSTTGAIESSDVFGMADGTTRSKYYGNQLAKDLSVRGVTGSGVGVYMAYGNRESSSGGPFFRDIQNQSGTDIEVYNYMNSGHNQTEAFRMGFHGPYALMFTSGAAPAVPDMSWMGNHSLSGWVAASGRGRVIGNGLAGRDGVSTYTVGFANATAQYWTTATSTGTFGSYNMKPGSYTMTVYKGELAVYTEPVTVTAGAPTTLNTRTINQDPASASAVWRIGSWDGTPYELKNGQTFAVRHPSDVRNTSWGPTTYAVGSATNAFPAGQWKTEANNPTTVTFNLTSAQIADRTVRIGITAATAGGRPAITINNWSSSLPGASTQPSSRSLTIGTYRGNNAMYTYAVPASAFVAGTNKLTINVISGSSGTAYLSPGFSYDALDML